MNRTLDIVKIGGNVVDDKEALDRFLSDFSKLPGPKILVHGGGKEATRLASALGVSTTMIEGRRVTDAATIEIVTMVYAGLVNKRIVSMLQAKGCDAVGLSGADGNVVRATRRQATPVDYGYVGDISTEGVNVGFIEGLTVRGSVPVLCAIMHDGAGQLLNCNADSVASALAIACAGVADVNLTYCFEMPGVLASPSDPSSVIARITPGDFGRLKSEGIVSGGMLPKIANAISAVEHGVAKVVIKSADRLLDTDSGTMICL